MRVRARACVFVLCARASSPIFTARLSRLSFLCRKPEQHAAARAGDEDEGTGARAYLSQGRAWNRRKGIHTARQNS